MVNPFEIPEILYLICQHVQRSDLARLMTTSGRFFGCALPFVWNSLPENAPLILAKLFPFGSFLPTKKLNGKTAKALPLDTQSLLRFNIYAPHVKRLALVRFRHDDEGNAIWDRILELVNSRPILPNLEVLDVYVFVYRAEDLDPVSYIEAYLSPTLVEVNNVRDTQSFVKPQILYQLVSTIVQEYPRISSLRLGDATGCSDPDPGQLANCLSQLQDIRVLGLGPVALNPAVLTVISALPNLETLELDQEGDPSIVFNSAETMDAVLKLPYESFPVLHRLVIYIRDKFELVDMIWSIPALLRRLTSISVRVYKPVQYSQICDFVRVIHQNSPSISDLEFNFRHSWCFRSLLKTDLFVHLSEFPLRRLYIWLVQQDDYQRFSGQQLVLAFPQMEDLEISGRDYTFEELAYIAENMPGLQHLSVSIQLSTDWPSMHKRPSPSFTPSPSQLYFRFPNSATIRYFSSSKDSQVAEKIAIGLHSLWPNRVTCTNEQGSDKDSRIFVDKVNAMLMYLRGVEGHHDQI
ncbi:unnamed protein product [Rhizoctonia solani]|uniref:Uncharacterized protein n=1 Tax=Rhizoctonia solani TaxID=456999 RepID=A0A8H2XDX8_9AGAM|nr:unnamed protein product [Rhizoctonia solani]